ncbi:BTB/POZ domain-containing protein kctd21 [Trebouxia sp. C0009 RCD-2024]
MLRVLHRSLLEHNRQTFGKASVQVVLRPAQLKECRASRRAESGTASAEAEDDIRGEAAADARDIIKLNIGGVKHTTTLATLTAVPGTYSTAVLCGDLTDILTQDGEVFIDRQGKCFEHILQYLRAKRYDQPFQLPESLQRDELAALATEAKFYRFARFHDSLREALRKPPPLVQHKFLYKESYTSWEEHGKQVQNLVKQGWELRETILSCAMGNNMGLTRMSMQDH